jgi:hypothetical protein
VTWPAPAWRAALPAPEVAPEDVRRLADEVLADPVFDRPSPGLVARARDWVLARLADLLEAVLEAAGGGPLGWALVTAFALAALALAAVVVRGVRRDPGAGTGPPAGPRPPAVAWLADAEAFEADGDRRGGLRCRHRALVAELAARGLLEEVPGRTAGEHRASLVRSAPAAAPSFTAATALFEDAWYGHRLVAADDTERFTALTRQVLDRAPAGTSGAAGVPTGVSAGAGR